MIINTLPDQPAGGLPAEVIDRLPARRASTREELWRRLSRGRAHLDARYADAADLSSTARAACLSPFHFLRLFKAAFGLTPHQYLTERRLSVAQEALARTARTVSEIGLSLGFENVNSFGRLFRRRFGITPQQFRRDASVAAA